MAVVKLVEKPIAGTEAVYQASEEFFGHVPNLVKALGSNKNMCNSITNFMIQSLGEGRISWAFKELIVLKTLKAMNSHYSYGAHEKIAGELGVSDEKLGDLQNSLWEQSPHFTEAEKLVFHLIRQIAIDANDVQASLWERLKEHWDYGQLIEINAVITTFLMIGRVGDALGVTDSVLFTKPLSNN
ncbi:MAG: carboxymuconolactone decarboxylase family protein [Cyclobacteriaceae bacterium]|nr:carboxymuconolactone decarboxylase family protein [Cyclobacteriaceae bacterium]